MAQLAADALHASFIADGIHIPPEALKVLLRAKTSGTVDPGHRRHGRRRHAARPVSFAGMTIRARRGRLRPLARTPPPWPAPRSPSTRPCATLSPGSLADPATALAMASTHPNALLAPALAHHGIALPRPGSAWTAGSAPGSVSSGLETFRLPIPRYSRRSEKRDLVRLGGQNGHFLASRYGKGLSATVMTDRLGDADRRTPSPRPPVRGRHGHRTCLPALRQPAAPQPARPRLPAAGQPTIAAEAPDGPAYPLHARICDDCKLVQTIGRGVPPRVHCRRQTRYLSSTLRRPRHAGRPLRRHHAQTPPPGRQFAGHRDRLERRLQAAPLPGRRHPGARASSPPATPPSAATLAFPPKQASSTPAPRWRSPSATAAPTWWSRTTCCTTCPTCSISPPASPACCGPTAC